MNDEQGQRGTPVSILAGIGAALVLALAALVWCLGLQNHLEAANRQLAAAAATNKQLEEKQEALSARLHSTTETFGQSVGMTQKQIDLRAESLLASQAAANRALAAQNAKLSEREEATAKQVTTVQSDVSTVRSDVTGTKASIADTQTDLAETKAQLQRTIGDAGVMSGLIARTHNDLEVLKHRGDRNYYEFTLQKGAKPTLLASVKLQAKKVDDKRSKYTLIVSSDDRNIEKKDKSLDEPVQFYSGKDPRLFEIVVNLISKNQVSGYMATPKGTPAPQNP